jgi:hypothetical protein|tara:strand:- start:247 stop:429 length:183 start_codon:yes stop_codon:yes gene_type:complete
MAGHKPMEKKRKKMMYGRTPMEGGGMYGMKRKKKTHGGPHKNMDRIGMAMGGAMEVQKPN